MSIVQAVAVTCAGCDCSCDACRPVCPPFDPVGPIPLADAGSPNLDDPRRTIPPPYATETRIVLPCANHGHHDLEISTPATSTQLEDRPMSLQYGFGQEPEPDDLDDVGRLLGWSLCIAAVVVLVIVLWG